MDTWVDISFDCLPLRSIERIDIPIDASPAYRGRCERILQAIEKHGSHNAYYLYNARCNYHLTNDPDQGTLKFKFEATVLTDAQDSRSSSCELSLAQLAQDTCDWVTEPIIQWFQQTLSRSVLVEFDRYIAVGDLDQTKIRIEKMKASSDETGGFVGMYL